MGKRLEIIETESMPELAAQAGCPFEPDAMINFLEKFLMFVRKTVEEEDVVYCFETKPEWEEIRFSSDSDKTKGLNRRESVLINQLIFRVLLYTGLVQKTHRRRCSS